MFNIVADYFFFNLKWMPRVRKFHIVSRNALSWEEFNSCCVNELGKVKLWTQKELRKVRRVVC